MFKLIKKITFFKFIALFALLSACSPRSGTVVADPLEPLNRRVHALNKGLDSNILSPVSKGYSYVMPDAVEDSVSNFASNLSLPGTVVNNVLQLDIPAAANNTVRFVVNSTIGLAGLFDPSESIGLAGRDTDFGQTLQRWGVVEGAYVEIPLFGPSNMRDGMGIFVDMMLDPTSSVLKPTMSLYRSWAGIGAILQKRQIYGDQIDEVLYDSADSYAQSRLVYLQNRRFQLKDNPSDAYIDPYTEFE